jgi:hypothetical protein
MSEQLQNNSSESLLPRSEKVLLLVEEDPNNGVETKTYGQEYQLGDVSVMFGVPEKAQREEHLYVERGATHSYEAATGNKFEDLPHDEKVQLLDTYAYAQFGGEFSTDVDALFFMLSKGDESSVSELEALVVTGKDKRQRHIQTRQQRSLEDFEKNGDGHRQNVAAEGLEDLDFDDIYLVHRTDFMPERTEDGYSIAAAEDVDPNSKGRATIHFSLNHPVESHIAGNWEDKKYTVIISLKAVLEANPGALDNLYSVDTYFSPDYESQLILPGAEVLEGADDARVRRELKGKGAKIFQGGMHYSSDGVDSRIWQLGMQQGVVGGLHANRSSGLLEQQAFKAAATGEKPDMNKMEEALLDLPDNSLRRAMAGSFSGTTTEETYPDFGRGI